MKPWYECSTKETCAALEVQERGLSEAEVMARRARDGENVLQEKKKKSIMMIFLEQFKDLLVLILILAAFVSLWNQETVSACVILFVIIMNAILGTIQYCKAEKSIQALKQMTSPSVRVIRDGEMKELSAEALVRGDLMILEAGDVVSADARILSTAMFQVNESALTGEVNPIEKQQDALPATTVLAERTNMIYAGSFVVNGRATAVVTETGMAMELGKIATMMKHVQENKTPLQRSLDDVSKKLSVAILVICVVVFVLQMGQGSDVLSALMFAVALAVAAIPEALASIVTIVLALGAQRMVKEHAIMKKLYSVETLGSVNVICSDKTGTLTQNRMTITDVALDHQSFQSSTPLVDQPLHEYFLAACTLCVDANITSSQRIGDPMELALLDYAQAQGISLRQMKHRYARLAELPFDSQRKKMATLHHMEDGAVLLVKGALDILFPELKYQYTARGIEEMTSADREWIKRQHDQYAKEGKRVLGFACKLLAQDELSEDAEEELIYLGMCAMMDPPRQESREAVQACHEAGIKTVMITGDHKDTAEAIARQTGILYNATQCVVTGSELDQMDEQQLATAVQDIAVYARVEPRHKQRIIQAFQKHGMICAMSGDGVNDAPALKQADIGIAMGITGTEVSKDAADMVLMDDNFATIVKAVSSGRTMVHNIKLAITYLLSGNFGAILCVLIASLAALPVPFLPIHLLFINLLSDSLPAIAIGVEPAEHDVLKEQPQKNGSLLNKQMLLRIALQGGVIAFCTMFAYFYGLQDSVQLAETMAFATLCLSRILHGLTSRSVHSLFAHGIGNNKASWISFLIGLVLLHLILFVPVLKPLFHIAPLTLTSLAMIWICAGASFLILQLSRFLRNVCKRFTNTISLQKQES